jgi:serine/threonine protein kinase
VIAPLQPDDPHAIGPYRLYGRVGCGGMGRVFLGLSADALPIAVKIIRAELAADREFRTRFRQEVAAAQKVSGRYTALVVDADLDGPVLWLATAYVAGPSLAKVVNSGGPLSVKQVLWLAAGLAEGLAAIHASGVVHCDLKPSNVLLAEDGPRVIDFGIARSAWASAVPGADADFGSPGFCSPEHVLGQVIGPPSDIFSLGAVLTFAATGQGPFGSGSSAALLWRLVNSSPRLDAVPARLRGLVGSCLAKHPDERPTASALMTQLGPVPLPSGWLPQASGIGASAAEPEPGRAGRDRFLRRIPVLVPGLLAAGAAAIFVLNGGLAPSPVTYAQPPTGTTAPPAGAQAQAQGAGPATTTPVPASSTRAASRHEGQARVAPSAYLSPFTPAVGPPTLSPSGPGSPSQSPSPSPSASSSGSASPSPSPSPSSSSPSPSPSSPSPSPSSSSSSPSPSPSSSSPSPSPSSSSPSPSPSSSSPAPSPSSPSPSSSSPSPSAPAT